jgi:hypothetical protein
MNKHIAAAVLTASVAGAGFAGFTITSALAEDNGNQATNVQVQAEGEDRGRDGPGHREERAQALADVIGISVEDLMAAKADGQTPAEIAEANDVSRDELVSALVDAQQERLDQAVEDERLTQEEADEKAVDLEDRANAIADGEHREGHHGPRGGDGAGAEEEGADA